MRSTFTKAGFNYLPVIVHADGKREVLYGDPLANGITATKYAALEIQQRRKGSQSWRESHDDKTTD